MNSLESTYKNAIANQIWNKHAYVDMVNYVHLQEGIFKLTQITDIIPVTSFF